MCVLLCVVRLDKVGVLEGKSLQQELEGVSFLCESLV